jgi:hypothetical protein
MSYKDSYFIPASNPMSISTNTSHRDPERKGRDTIIKGIHSNHAAASYFTHANAPAKKKQIQGQTETPCY